MVFVRLPIAGLSQEISEAPSHGLPALMYDPENSGSQSYIQLATEFLEREYEIA